MAREMTFGESTGTMEVPAGRYVARFVGTEDRKPFEESRFGNTGEPRMGWLFEVAEGPDRGKRISQESGCRASPSSTAARMIAGLTGGDVQLGQRLDVDQFIGRLYVVKVAVNPKSDKGNLHVADLEPHPAAAAAPAPSPPRPAPRPQPVPPRPPGQPAPSPSGPQRYYVYDGVESQERSWQEVHELYQQLRADGADLSAVKVAKVESPDIWRSLEEMSAEFVF
jgi:hypothetical protein